MAGEVPGRTTQPPSAPWAVGAIGSSPGSQPEGCGFESRTAYAGKCHAVVVNSADTSVFQTEEAGSVPADRSTIPGCSAGRGDGTLNPGTNVGSIPAPGAHTPGAEPVAAGITPDDLLVAGLTSVSCCRYASITVAGMRPRSVAFWPTSFSFFVHHSRMIRRRSRSAFWDFIAPGAAGPAPCQALRAASTNGARCSSKLLRLFSVRSIRYSTPQPAVLASVAQRQEAHTPGRRDPRGRAAQLVQVRRAPARRPPLRLPPGPGHDRRPHPAPLPRRA